MKDVQNEKAYLFYIEVSLCFTTSSLNIINKVNEYATNHYQ
jgi:hypothetical protein